MKKMSMRLIVMLLTLTVSVLGLIGGTIAWFTDEVTSESNIIQAGNLDVEMYWAEGKDALDTAVWENAAEGAIFDYNLWEPGYTQVRHIKIENKGTLALKYQLQLEADGEVSKLADVIDVYFFDPAQQIADRTDLTATPIGNLTSVLAAMPGNTAGSLKAGDTAAVTVALKMQESANNDYQGLSIGSSFALKLVATQDTVENDSFDNTYDADAEFPGPVTIKVSSADELVAALESATDGTIIDAEGVIYRITAADYFFEIPAGVTMKNATIIADYRGHNYVMFEGEGESIVFENCSFGTTTNTLVLGGTTDGPDAVVYDNCTFEGPIITNWVDNPDGIATFNNCTFTKAQNSFPASKNFTEGMGGTHVFNSCTFDYTGVTQASMGVITSGSVNVYSESEYSTTVILNGCTRTNCGTRTYGPSSTLTIK